MPDQRDNMMSLAWFSKAAHPETAIEFDWTTQYNFVWSDQNGLTPGITFKASQLPEMEPSDIASNSINKDEPIGAFNALLKPHPRYWVAFGNFKEGDTIDVSTLENAIELKPEDAGKTLVIDEDNTLHID